MSELLYPTLVHKLSDEDGGGYLALALDLHGCMSDGSTPEEALKNLEGAIQEWIAETTRLGRDIPLPGSAAENARRERTELQELVIKQDELLRKSIADLKDEVGEVKERVEALMSRVDQDTDRYFWGHVIPAVHVPRRRTRQRDGGVH